MDLNIDIGHYGGAPVFPYKRVGGLKVALLALKVSKMSENNHKREKLNKTLKKKNR